MVKGAERFLYRRSEFIFTIIFDSTLEFENCRRAVVDLCEGNMLTSAASDSVIGAEPAFSARFAPLTGHFLLWSCIRC